MVQNQSWSPGSSLQAERESRRAARTPSPHARSLLAWTLNGWTKRHEWAKGGQDFKKRQEWMNGSKKFQIRLFWPGTVKHTSFGRMLVLKELPQSLEWSFDKYASKSNGGKQLSWWDEADQPRPPFQEMSWRVTRFFGSGLFLSQSFTQCRVAGSGRRGSNGIRHGTLLQISTQGFEDVQSPSSSSLGNVFFTPSTASYARQYIWPISGLLWRPWVLLAQSELAEILHHDVDIIL